MMAGSNATIVHGDAMTSQNPSSSEIRLRSARISAPMAHCQSGARRIARTKKPAMPMTTTASATTLMSSARQQHGHLIPHPGCFKEHNAELTYTSTNDC